MILINQPIQWHRNTSKHDYCPECGSGSIAYFGRRHRHCRSCGLTIRLKMTPNKWLASLKTKVI